MAIAADRTVKPTSGGYPPLDPDPPGPLYAMSYMPVRGFSLVLFIVALLLCINELMLGFVAFMVLGLAFEIIDVLVGVKTLEQVWNRVRICITGWRAGAPNL